MSALIASAAASLPTQATVPPSTSSAVAKGSAGLRTRPLRYSVVVTRRA